MKKIFLFLSLIALSVSANAESARARDYYAGFRIANTAEWVDFDNFDDTLRVHPVGFGLVGGYRFNQNIKMDLEIDYMSASDREDTFRLTTTSGLVNMYWSWLDTMVARSYIGAGMGASNLSLDAPGYGRGRNDLQFTYQLSMGVDFILNDYFSVDIGIRWREMGFVRYKESGDNYFADIYALQFYAGMVYKW